MFSDAFHVKLDVLNKESDKMDVDSVDKEKEKNVEMAIEDGEIKEEVKINSGESLEDICKELFPSLSPPLSSLFWSFSLYDLFVPKGIIHCDSFLEHANFSF